MTSQVALAKALSSMISQARREQPCFRRDPAFETKLFDPSDDNDTMRPRATAHSRLPWFVPSVPRLLSFYPKHGGGGAGFIVLPETWSSGCCFLKTRHYFLLLPFCASPLCPGRTSKMCPILSCDAAGRLCVSFVVTACIDLAGCLCCGRESSCRIEVRDGSPTVVGVDTNVELACWLLRSRPLWLDSTGFLPSRCIVDWVRSGWCKPSVGWTLAS
jgi:hypothetical protein